MSPDLVAAANRNLIACNARLADHSETGGTRRFGSVVAAATDVPVPIFNRVFVFERPDPDDLAEAVAWLAERENPFWVTATESAAPDVADLAPTLGLDAGEPTQPGMALASLESLPEPSGVIDLERVTDRESLETWTDLAGEVFEIPEPVSRRITPPSILEEPDAALLLGRVDGDPVATGLAVVSDDVAGVYTIAVRESHRRQGIGEEMTWATLRVGRDAGCRVGVLQSSEMGFSVYDRMGFETVVTYRHFSPAAAE